MQSKNKKPIGITALYCRLSRLGRDYVSVGNYTDSYFPEHNVRFITVNDAIDSDEGESEIAPFKKYLKRNVRKRHFEKVRSSHRLRGSMGEPLSQPPYGYMKSPNNKKKWIVDPEVATVVKSIFKMCLDGKGNETIARKQSARTYGLLALKRIKQRRKENTNQSVQVV